MRIIYDLHVFTLKISVESGQPSANVIKTFFGTGKKIGKLEKFVKRNEEIEVSRWINQINVLMNGFCIVQVFFTFFLFSKSVK